MLLGASTLNPTNDGKDPEDNHVHCICFTFSLGKRTFPKQITTIISHSPSENCTCHFAVERMHCSRFPSQYSQLFRILLRKNALFQVPKPLITFFHIFHILPRENALFKVPMPIITFFSHVFHILLRENALFKVPMPIITLFSHFFTFSLAKMHFFKIPKPLVTIFHIFSHFFHISIHISNHICSTFSEHGRHVVFI